MKVFAHRACIDNKETEAAPLSVAYCIWDMSASLPVGVCNVLALAGYASRRTSDAVGPIPATSAGGNVQRKLLTVGCAHWLSKRTEL